MKIVFLTTVQFSGTRLLHLSVAYATQPHFSRMQIANVKGFYRIADTVEGTLTHTNTSSIKELIAGVKERFSKVVSSCEHFTCIVTAHNGDGFHGFIPFTDQEMLIDTFPTATALRDPLSSLLTREGRRPDDCHQYLIDGFVSLAKTNRKLFYVPVDLYAGKSFEKRFILLEGLFDFLGIVPIEKDYITKMASEWLIRGDIQNDASVSDSNKKRAAQLKSWHQQWDIQRIIRAIPRSYKYLKDREPIIRPMLEQAGYKNLLWWD